MYLISSGAFHFFAILHWSYVEIGSTLWCVQVELAIAARYHRLEGIETLAAALGGSSVTTMGLTACGLDTESFRILRDALNRQWREGVQPRCGPSVWHITWAVMRRRLSR